MSMNRHRPDIAKQRRGQTVVQVAAVVRAFGGDTDDQISLRIAGRDRQRRHGRGVVLAEPNRLGRPEDELVQFVTARIVRYER